MDLNAFCAAQRACIKKMHTREKAAKDFAWRADVRVSAAEAPNTQQDVVEKLRAAGHPERSQGSIWIPAAQNRQGESRWMAEHSAGVVFLALSTTSFVDAL
jgi:hypothetical protein